MKIFNTILRLFNKPKKERIEWLRDDLPGITPMVSIMNGIKSNKVNNNTIINKINEDSSINEIKIQDGDFHYHIDGNHLSAIDYGDLIYISGFIDKNKSFHSLIEYLQSREFLRKEWANIKPDNN